MLVDATTLVAAIGCVVSRFWVSGPEPHAPADYKQGDVVECKRPLATAAKAPIVPEAL